MANKFQVKQPTALKRSIIGCALGNDRRKRLSTLSEKMQVPESEIVRQALDEFFLKRRV